MREIPISYTYFQIVINYHAMQNYNCEFFFSVEVELNKESNLNL